MQGKYIPCFLGHFSVKFEDRELLEDRVCKVLMLEVLDGKNLRTFPVTKLSSLERTLIREQVLEITTSVYGHGIFFPDISLDKFLLLKADKSIRLFGFSVTYDLEEFGLDTKEREGQVQRTIASVIDNLYLSFSQPRIEKSDSTDAVSNSMGVLALWAFIQVGGTD